MTRISYRPLTYLSVSKEARVMLKARDEYIDKLEKLVDSLSKENYKLKELSKLKWGCKT